MDIIFRKIKNSNKKIKISNPEEDKFINDYIESNSVYKLLYPALEIVVKQTLNLSLEA